MKAEFQDAYLKRVLDSAKRSLCEPAHTIPDWVVNAEDFIAWMRGIKTVPDPKASSPKT